MVFFNLSGLLQEVASGSVKEKERQKQMEKLKQASEVSAASASEIDKIKAVIDQSTKGFEPSNFIGRTPGVPNEHYVCKRCNQKGHFVGNCPNVSAEDRVIEPRYKRTTGIPSTMLTIVDDPLHPGALLTTTGQFAVPTVDVPGYKEVKKERPPFLPVEKQSEPEKKKIPQELLCHICEDLCVDAAIAPCCGTSFCDECLREELLESEDHQCPSCKETNVSPDRIVANRSMRMAVNNFLNDTGYTKVKRRRSSSHSGDAQNPLMKSPSTDARPETSSAAESVSSSGQISIIPGSSIPSQLSNHSGRLPYGSRNRQHYSDRYYNKFQPSLYSHSNFAYSQSFLNQMPKPWLFHQSGNQAVSHLPIINRDDSKQHYPYEHTSGPQSSTSVTSQPSITQGSTSATNLSIAVTVDSASDNKSNNNSTLSSSWPSVVSTVPSSLSSYQSLQSGPAVKSQTYTGFPPVGHQATPNSYPSEQAPTAAAKKPVDVFDSFADFTKRRSRSPERRGSHANTGSAEWSKRRSWSRSPTSNKHKLSPRASNLSPSKHTSQSYTPRRSPSLGDKRNSHSLSPRSLPGRHSRSRSGARSLNRSRSRSFGPPRLSSKQRSRTRSPRSRSRQHSLSPPRHSSKLLSPKARGSLSPLPRRPSSSPLRHSPDSPLPHKTLKSTVHRSSKSPIRRRSPISPPRRSSKSSLHRSSKSPLRRLSKSPYRRSSTSSLRRSPKSSLRRSKSPFKRSSKSPLRRSKSPFRRSSQSPLRNVSKSPLRRSSKSPLRRSSKSPRRRLSESPLRRSSKSPLRRSSKSPLRRSSRSPLRRLARSPLRRSSKSPLRKSSLSPYRRSSKTPLRGYSKSPHRYSKSPLRRSSISPRKRSSKSPVYRERSRSWSYRRITRSRSKSYTRRPKSRSYSKPRSPLPYSASSPRRSPAASKNRSPLRSPQRKYSLSPYRRSSRSPTPTRKSPIYKSRSRSLSRRRYSPKFRSRSPLPKSRRSLSPRSPVRSKSPYKKPLSPLQQRRSPSPWRGRGGYGGRGRGGMGRGGYRDFTSGLDKFHTNSSPPRDGSQTGNFPANESGMLPSGNLPPVPYFPSMGLPPPEEYFRNDPAGYQEFVRNFYSQFGAQAQAWAQSQTFPTPPAGSSVESNLIPPGQTGLNNPFQQPNLSSHGTYRTNPVADLNPEHRLPWEQSGPVHNSSHHVAGVFPRDRRDQHPRDRRDMHRGRPWERDRMPRERERFEGEREPFKRGEKARNFDRPQDWDRGRDRDRAKDLDRNRVEKSRDGDRSRFTEKNRESDRTRTHDRGRDLDRHHREGERRDRIKETDRSKGKDALKSEKDKSKDRERNKDKAPNDKKKSPIHKSKEDDKNKIRKKSEKKKDDVRKPKPSSEIENNPDNIPKVSLIRKTSPVSDKELDIPNSAPDKNEQKLEGKNVVKQEHKEGNQALKSETVENKAKLSLDLSNVEKAEVKERKVGAKKKGDILGIKKKKDTLTETDATGSIGKKVKKVKKKKLTFGAPEADSKQGLKKKKLKRAVDYKSEPMSEDGEEKVSLGGSPLKKSRVADIKSSEAHSHNKPSAVASESAQVTSSGVTNEKIHTPPLEGFNQNSEASAERKDGVAHQFSGENRPDGQGETAENTQGEVPEIPQLSKWERDDFDLYETVDQPKHLPPKKMMLPRSVVDKAEKFLSQKPMKNAVMVAHVTTSTKSPETSPEKPEKTAPEKVSNSQRSDSLSPKISNRRFVEHRRDSKDKKAGELQITVKTAVSKHKGESVDRKRSSSKNDDHRSSHHHHHNNRDSFEEDQRSVVKSRSLERELKEQKSKSQKTQTQDKELNRDSKWKSSFSTKSEEKHSKDTKDTSKKDRNDSHKEKHRGRSPSPADKHTATSRHRDSKDNEHEPASSYNSSKDSSKDLRHRLDEKNKAKSAVDHRKLSVMDEAEFVPDYEDLMPHGASETEQGDGTSSHDSPASSQNEKDTKKRKREDSREDGEGKSKAGEENESGKDENEDEAGKHKKSKKKHKHKEKSKEKKEKHKHKKKKHKHKKSKEMEEKE
ncbi:E3 ubiquitin-protein ligase rbbp6 [Plakobranchus ocellatus]|uniref:E3 ubiquitin-protein ligase rbbp6 n=1 Tax=Plakobranchus ocellatus TaxID=259542 RepID=A0AAV3Y8G2_9GAST|nr:E3 ubiquitin-protein ligase rbbp6 [Plakobranchus ocellatus]